MRSVSHLPLLLLRTLPSTKFRLGTQVSCSDLPHWGNYSTMGPACKSASHCATLAPISVKIDSDPAGKLASDSHCALVWSSSSLPLFNCRKAC